MTITLERAGVRCVVDPANGGSIRSLDVAGRALLRPTPDGADDILDSACFPLVPFANRIAAGRFVHRGTEIVLPADPAAPPHAHHGFGWRNAWTVAREDGATVELRYEHAPDAWPWHFVATQTIALRDDGAAITLTVENRSPTPMPCGLGVHPYFVRDAASALVTGAAAFLANGPDDLPIGPRAFAPGRHPLNTLEPFDNLLLDASGSIALDTAGIAVTIAAPDAVGYHVYVPRGGDFFCVEPVSHRPNSFQATSLAEQIAPGDRMEFTLTITTPGAASGR